MPFTIETSDIFFVMFLFSKADTLLYISYEKASSIAEVLSYEFTHAVETQNLVNNPQHITRERFYRNRPHQLQVTRFWNFLLIHVHVQYFCHKQAILCVSIFHDF